MECFQVKERQLPKSISCGKTFRGHTALKDFPTVHKWLGELASELEERISADREENERTPGLLTVRTSFLPFLVIIAGIGYDLK